MNRRRVLAPLLLLALAACSPAPPPIEPFPHTLLPSLLNATAEDAFKALHDAWPDTSATDTPLLRAFPHKHPWLDEIDLFTSIRSGRVDTVILKYRADLDPAQRRTVLDATRVPDLPQRLDDAADAPIELSLKPGVLLRARRADKQGRLTLTVEPTPEPAKPSN